MSMQYLDLLGVLSEEIRMTKELAGLVQPEYHRRLLVRVLFSTLEAYCFMLKQQTLVVGNSNGYHFSNNESEMLREVREKKKQDGTVENRPWFPPIKQNISFSIRIFSQVYGVKEPAPVPAEELEIVLNVRHRLTHPKEAAGFRNSEIKSNAVATLYKWFMEVIQWYSKSEQDYLHNKAAELNESSDRLIEKLKRM